MLAFTHTAHGQGSTAGHLVIAAALVREADVNLLAVGEKVEARDVGTGVLQYAVVVRGPELIRAISIEQCVGALYRRVRILIESGLLPRTDYPSIFWRISGDAADAVRSAIETSATHLDLSRPDFPELASAGSSVGGRLAMTVAMAIGRGSPGDADLIQAVGSLRQAGVPGSWLHYTLDSECDCPGCMVVRAAVFQEACGPSLTPPSEIGPNTTSSKPTSPTIAVLGLPWATHGRLLAAGVTLIDMLSAMDDLQLLSLRHIEKRDVRAIREAVAQYSLKRWGMRPITRIT